MANRGAVLKGRPRPIRIGPQGLEGPSAWFDGKRRLIDEARGK